MNKSERFSIVLSLCGFAPLRETPSWVAREDSRKGAKLAKFSPARTVAIGIAITLFLFLISDSTLAQCVMCRASLSNNHSFIRNFNIGVLVLLVPPVSIFCAIFIIAIRHRKSD